MAQLTIEPDKRFDFVVFFKTYKNLQKKVPYSFKIVRQYGDLIFISKNPDGTSNEKVIENTSVFEKECINDLYSLKTLDGCSIAYEISQSGKKITS